MARRVVKQCILTEYREAGTQCLMTLITLIYCGSELLQAGRASVCVRGHALAHTPGVDVIRAHTACYSTPELFTRAIITPLIVIKSWQKHRTLSNKYYSRDILLRIDRH